jgi:Luciferase-like monooxygenase
VIGGSGERRTLRIVAEHGDIWNTLYGDLDHYRHLLDVLARHCADVGRDPADVRKSLTFRVILDGDEPGGTGAPRAPKLGRIRVGHFTAGVTFTLRRKRLSGSYRRFTSASRSRIAVG